MSDQLLEAIRALPPRHRDNILAALQKDAQPPPAEPQKTYPVEGAPHMRVFSPGDAKCAATLFAPCTIWRAHLVGDTALIANEQDPKNHKLDEQVTFDRKGVVRYRDCGQQHRGSFVNAAVYDRQELFDAARITRWGPFVFAGMHNPAVLRGILSSIVQDLARNKLNVTGDPSDLGQGGYSTRIPANHGAGFRYAKLLEYQRRAQSIDRSNRDYENIIAKIQTEALAAIEGMS